MKKVSHIFILSLFCFVLESSCSENDDPSIPVILTPTLTGFSPTSGTEGTTVTLTGTNFSTTPANNSVKFNGTTAVVTAATSSSLTVSVPTGATTGKITVQVDSEIATSANDFVFIESDEAIVETLTGNGTLGSEDGTGAAARFYQPTGVALDVTGNIYVADYANHLIRKITPTGTVTTLAGSGIAGYADGTGTAAQFNGPFGLAVDAEGNVYVADSFNHRIRKITPAGIVSTLAGSGVYGFADGDGIAAKFYSPRGLTVDGSGNTYVADVTNHRIRKISPAGVVTTLAGSISGNTNGNASDATFAGPTGITVDASGNIYVADTGNHRIRKITSAGEVSTLAGSTSGISEGVGTDARFSGPTGIALDASGNFYVADEENERIRKITPDGTVSTFAGGYLSGFTNGAGEDAQFRSPTGIALDASGNVYIADRHNHSIRKIQ